ncbi:hypothetical protein SEA_YARA_40 [Streptomyces phage Yara]|nr:hypothetical protein SEA_YARA_40 [Streptomyces phage Yara]
MELLILAASQEGEIGEGLVWGAIVAIILLVAGSKKAK